MTTHTTLPPAVKPAPATIHPLWLRLTHWLNALAVLIMVTSGWQIYNASPLFDFDFPSTVTLGGWLGGERSPKLAPHLAQKLLRRAGERLRSTLDADLQGFASAALNNQLRAKSNKKG